MNYTEIKMTPFVLIAFVVLSNATAVYQVNTPEDDPTLFATKAECEKQLEVEKAVWAAREKDLGPIQLGCIEYEGVIKQSFPVHTKDLKNNT